VVGYHHYLNEMERVSIEMRQLAAVPGLCVMARTDSLSEGLQVLAQLEVAALSWVVVGERRIRASGDVAGEKLVEWRNRVSEGVEALRSHCVGRELDSVAAYIDQQA
jgi:hypothetical protein